MKVRDLFEQAEHKTLSETEFDNLPAPDAKNINDRYKVGKIAFDNIDGMGAIPNNREIKYFGFVVTMTPSVFLRFAAAGDRSETASKIAELIKQRVPLGAPYLEIKINEKQFEDGEPLVVQVVGHEGRARMTAIQTINGDMTKIPVHVKPRGETRARHLDEKFFQALRDQGMVPEKMTGEPRDAHIGKIYWMGKTL